MKSEKGMGCIMMFLCIAIIIALIWGIVYFTQMKYEEEQIETLKTNLLTLQSKVRILSEEVTMKKEGVSYTGKKLSENLEDECIKKLIEDNIITSEDEQYAEYYILESEDFKSLGLENYDIQKVIVNYLTCEIIYPDGFYINEKIYYKLSDFKSTNNEDTPTNEQETNIEQENIQVNEEG